MLNLVELMHEALVEMETWEEQEVFLRLAGATDAQVALAKEALAEIALAKTIARVVDFK